MTLVIHILFTIAWMYCGLILFYLMITWVKTFARDWYPRGFSAICIESLLSLTDPPINAIRKVIKPINIGGMSIDLSVFILLILVQIIMIIMLHLTAM